MLASDERELVAQLSGWRARETTASLYPAGERVAGGAAEVQTARRVRELLSPWVDRCVLESFDVTTYLRGRARLEITSPVQLEIAAEVNPIAPADVGEAVLVDAGAGDRTAYRHVDVKGRVALVSASFGGLSGAAREGIAHGARVLVCHVPRVREDLVSVHGVNANIPILTISNRDAARLREVLRLHSDVRVRFEAPQEASRGTSYNVVGEIRGARFPNEVIYLSGHHDTWFQAANDNLVSVAGLVEMARLFHRERPARTLRFISFGGEESGKPLDTDPVYWDAGSTAYSQQHLAALSGEGEEIPVAIINGEIIGYTDLIDVRATPELLPLVRQVIDDLGLRGMGKEAQPFWSGSDHLCFHTLGVPSVLMMPPNEGLGSRGLPSYWTIYHTPVEDMRHVDALVLEGNTRLWALAAMRLANGEEPALDVSSFAHVATRGIASLAASTRLHEVLVKAGKRCETGATREDRLRLKLGLLRLLHRGLFAFHGPTIYLRLESAVEAAAKLEQASRLLPDITAATAIMATAPSAEMYRYLSPSSLEHLRKLQASSSVLSRLSPFWLELSDAWDALEGPRSGEAAALLQAKAVGIRKQAESWLQEVIGELESFVRG